MHKLLSSVFMDLKSVMQACSMCISLSQNVRLCTTHKWLNLEARICAHVYMLTRYIYNPIFIEVINRKNVWRQGKFCENLAGAEE